MTRHHPTLSPVSQQTTLPLLHIFCHSTHHMLYQEHQLHRLWPSTLFDLLLGLILTPSFPSCKIPYTTLLSNQQPLTLVLPQDSNPGGNSNTLFHMTFLFGNIIETALPHTTVTKDDLIFLRGYYVASPLTHQNWFATAIHLANQL